MIKMKMNKKGAAWFSFLIAVIVISGFLVIIYYIPEVNLQGKNYAKTIQLIGQYIFGVNDDLQTKLLVGKTALTTTAAVICAMMIWLIIFVAFGDIFESFSAFSKPIAWSIAFALAVIAAMTGFVGSGVIWLTYIFIWAGAAAIYLGLATALFAFLAVSFGASFLTNWLKNRKTMMESEDIRRGGKKTKATLQALGETGKGYLTEG